jgi:hypothetical protein
MAKGAATRRMSGEAPAARRSARQAINAPARAQPIEMKRATVSSQTSGSARVRSTNPTISP